ncbi:hypothetical protein V8F20_007851 [Naviculisporaceae sp. PSN 640]
MRFTVINALLVASTATAASIPRQPLEQPQIVLADLARSQLDHQQAQSTPLPIPAPEEAERIRAGQTLMVTTTVTKTATVAMTTATVIRTETVLSTATATPNSSSKSSSSLHWSWSLKNWLWRSGHCKDKDDTENEMTKLKGLEVDGLIDPKRLGEGMGCFCSAGSVCCYNSNAQIMCNYGSCGVI